MGDRQRRKINFSIVAIRFLSSVELLALATIAPQQRKNCFRLFLLHEKRFCSLFVWVASDWGREKSGRTRKSVSRLGARHNTNDGDEFSDAAGFSNRGSLNYSLLHTPENVPEFGNSHHNCLACAVSS
jgi:hypothetical protein